MVRCRSNSLNVPRPIIRGLVTSLVLGCCYGILDVHLPMSVGIELPLLILFAVGLLLGRSCAGAWCPVVSVGLYFAHVAAMTTGYKARPYVEDTAYQAISCFWSLLPLGLGAALGSIKFDGDDAVERASADQKL